MRQVTLQTEGGRDGRLSSSLGLGRDETRKGREAEMIEKRRGEKKGNGFRGEIGFGEKTRWMDGEEKIETRDG